MIIICVCLRGRLEMGDIPSDEKCDEDGGDVCDCRGENSLRC